jgi:hypothetical protein
MTTTETASAPAQNNAARTGMAIGGGVLATVGAVFALGGGGILAIGGTDGAFKTSHHDVSTTTSALVSEVAKINGTSEVTDVLGHPKVRISANAVQSDKPVFVGVGPKAQVDRYLAGASVETVTDFELDPFSLDKTRSTGTATLKPPATQSFWVAKSSGSTAKLDWKVRDGNYRVVVMNADGSRGVATQTAFEVKVPHLGDIAIAMLIAGLIAIGGGIALIAPSIRGGGSSKPQVAGPSPYAVG